jgi:hypothetical protein
MTLPIAAIVLALTMSQGRLTGTPGPITGQPPRIGARQ